MSIMAAGATSTAEPGLRIASLDNGLTVLIQEVHTAPLVSVWCWYRVGSKDEGPGLTGVSHWVEHMNFKGTSGIPRERMKGLIDRHGGTWNGYTWIDQTAYFETATRDALDDMLFLEAQRMAEGLYDPAECESERTVIISELHGSENDPEQLLDTEVTATALKVHPYRHPTIGWLPDLERMGREDLYGHYRRYYAPNNATLVVVGDVAADHVLHLAERSFGLLAPAPQPARVTAVEPPQIGERRVTIEREATATYLKLAYHAPALSEPDFFPMLALDAVLTGAKGLNLWVSFRGVPPQRRSRLYRALVEQGLASSVSGALLPTEHPFLYTISATAAVGTPAATLEAVALAALDEVCASGVTDDELARAKRQLRARLVLQNDSVTNIAHQLGYYHTIQALDLYHALESRIDAVTQADVAAVAGRYLEKSGRTIGTYVPLPGSSPPGAEDAGRRRRGPSTLARGVS
jgi:zinc protease